MAERINDSELIRPTVEELNGNTIEVPSPKEAEEAVQRAIGEVQRLKEARAGKLLRSDPEMRSVVIY